MLRPLMQAIIGTEAGLGFFLNIFVLRVISKLSDKTLQHYKFCLTVATLHSILTSISNVNCVLTHIIDHDAVYSSFNGLVLFFPKWASDLSLVIWILLTGLIFTTFPIDLDILVFAWTSLPAAFMLQYMIIVRHSMATWKILSYIYLTCLFISTPIFFTISDAFPLPSFAETLEPTVRSMYGLSVDERVLVYGGTLFRRPENGNRTFALYIFLGVGVTFSASYGIVLFCVRGILKAIREQTANNNARSSKSLKMQKRFITMLMLEATVPFFFLGVCVGVFTIAGLVGVELGLYALIMSTFVAMVPAVQAILYIWHLRGRSSDRSPPRNTTVSQRTTARSTVVTSRANQESVVANDANG